MWAARTLKGTGQCCGRHVQGQIFHNQPTGLRRLCSIESVNAIVQNGRQVMEPFNTFVCLNTKHRFSLYCLLYTTPLYTILIRPGTLTCAQYSAQFISQSSTIRRYVSTLWQKEEDHCCLLQQWC